MPGNQPPFRNGKQSWRLADLSLADLQSRPPEVAMLLFGATEPHGMHLPYGTDCFQVEAVADRACEIAASEQARVVRFPVIPFGVQSSQQAFPLAINLYPSTLAKILDDLAESIENSGIRKAIILNGHGGNDFYTWLKESFGRRNVFFLQVHWYQVEQELARQLFPAGGDHANDLETSLMLYLHEQLVDMSSAGPQPMAQSRLTAMREGWARTPRAWHLFTQDSGAGDPRAATAAKGQQFFEATCQRLAKLIVELDRVALDDRFPFI